MVPQTVAFEATAGDPTAAFDLTAVPAVAPETVSFSARAGDPTASFDLTAILPAQAVSFEATAGDPTATFDLSAIDPSDVVTPAAADNEFKPLSRPDFMRIFQSLQGGGNRRTLARPIFTPRRNSRLVIEDFGEETYDRPTPTRQSRQPRQTRQQQTPQPMATQPVAPEQQQQSANQLQSLAQYLYQIGENLVYLDSQRTAVAEEIEELEAAVDDAGGDLDWNAGLYAPWVYGLLYNNRNENSAVSTGGGAWTLTKTVAGVESQVGADDPIPWDDITKMTLSERDADGVNRRVVYQSEDLETGRLIIGIRYEDDDENIHVIALQQTDAIEDNGDNTYGFPVTRTIETETFDVGTPDDIVPPLDSDYSVRLLLPDVRRYTGIPIGRTLGWFWVNADASTATDLDGITDADAWPASAVTAANGATPGPNVPGDTVTLYRGSEQWSRSWDGELWEPAEQFIDGLLVVTGSITARALAAQVVTAEKMLLGPFMEGNAAGELTIGDIQSSNFVAGTSGWRIRLTGLAEFDAAVIRGELQVDQINPSVASIRTMWVGKEEIPESAWPDDSEGVQYLEVSLASDVLEDGGLTEPHIIPWIDDLGGHGVSAY